MVLVPTDWDNPQWPEWPSQSHDWKSYVNKQVREMWDTFTPEQKQAIAQQQQEIAEEDLN